jgi:ABC-type Na+ efflux pump permease subunit
MASLARSRELCRGKTLSIFSLVVLTKGLWLITQVVAGKIVMANATSSDLLARSRNVFLGFLVVSILFGALKAVLSSVVYHDLRTHKEGVDSKTLAAVFE